MDVAEIGFVRIDSRMIHGQITTSWNNVVRATKIVVIDDAVAANEMLAMGLQFAAPSGTQAFVYSVETAVNAWKENQFGKGRAMVLFRDVETAYRTWKAGFMYTDLNIGNIPQAPGRIAVYKTCFMNHEEAELLKEMEQNQVKIYLQFMPQEKIVPLNKLLVKIGG